MTLIESPLPPTAARPPRVWRSWMPAEAGPVFGLAVVFVLFSILSYHTFFTLDNIAIMLMQTAIVGTAALGMTLIIVSGGIDLSVGSTVALTCVFVALLLKWKFNPVLAALGGTALGAAAGLVIGLLVTQLRLAPFIVTLGTWGAYRGLAKGFANQEMVLTHLPESSWLRQLMRLNLGSPADWATRQPWEFVACLLPALFFIAAGELVFRLARPALSRKICHAITAGCGLVVGLVWRWHWLDAGLWLISLAPAVWITLALVMLVSLALRYTRPGRYVFAVGSNEQTAHLCGVPVKWTKVWIYVVGGIFAGLAGVLQFSKLTVGDPTTAGGMELDVIAAVVIGGASLTGGQGSAMGSLVGALLMVVVANGCQSVGMKNWTQEIITGGIIVLAAAIDRFQHRRNRSG